LPNASTGRTPRAFSQCTFPSPQGTGVSTSPVSAPEESTPQRTAITLLSGIPSARAPATTGHSGLAETTHTEKPCADNSCTSGRA
jgi:hypothetical protein